MFHYFLPAHVKKGKRLLEGVKKFLHYHRDLIADDRMETLLAARDDYKAALDARDKSRLEQEEKVLIQACERAVPNYKSDSVKENIEVIIVAVVIALGIRAYFLQPFKIPTASMQPTLNGIIGHRMAPEESFPNIVKQGWQFLWNGANHTELKAPASSGPLFITRIQQQSLAMFFTRTIVHFSDGSSAWAYCPARQLFRDLWLTDNEEQPFGPETRRDLPATDSYAVDVKIRVQPGKILARGRVDTGDQVLVDKVSYHFRRPARGEVFVFSTKGIAGIEVPPGADSQHYIKRLVGVPNDSLELAPPELRINGKSAEEFGIRRVVESKDNPQHDPTRNMYHGYTYPGRRADSSVLDTVLSEHDGKTVLTYKLHDRQYMACGDNSGNSSDSRYWGTVPQDNLVGPALLVYWPFSPHGGFIK
ncbi:MAG: signal peptidase I [Verrucomicrobiales bacterium]|nr:signal peptidase I [Verrucomicrobiales bacterium]